MGGYDRSVLSVARVEECMRTWRVTHVPHAWQPRMNLSTLRTSIFVLKPMGLARNQQQLIILQVAACHQWDLHLLVVAATS